MNKGERLRGLAAALAILGVGVGPRLAVAAATFAEAAEVVVVEVPVQVVKDGEPVRGLTAEQFEVFDGRKKVALAGFEVLDLAAAAPARGAAEASIPVSARRHFLLLFDLTFSDPNALSRAREAAKGVLDDLHPTDLVSVATYSAPSGPQMILGFTPDRAQAVAAIDTLGLPKLFTPAGDPLRLVLTDTGGRDQALAGGAGVGADVRAALEAEVIDKLKDVSLLTSRAEKSVEQLMVRNMTAAFADLARLMSEIDGRKYLVLLSEGFDSSLVTGSGGSGGGNDLQNLIEAADSPDQISGTDGGSGSDAQFGDTRTQNALEKMLTELRRADCQIQAVDIGGLRALAQEGRLHGNGRESLLTMAKSTGGELFENFNNLSAAMQQMLRRTGVTYVLSFQPQALASDGSFHKLRVELRNAPRGARVVHRPGYYAPRPYKEQPPLQRLLQAGSTLMGEEGGRIDAAVLVAPFAAQGERAYVPVVVEVDGPTFLAGNHEQKVPLEIYVYAIDDQGAVQDFLTQSLGVDLGKAEAAIRQSGVKFFGHLELPKGTYTVRTLVRNGATGASSVRVRAVRVPGYGSGEAALLPALFPEPAGRWVMVRETLRAGAPQAPYPFMSKGEPYIPSSEPLLVPGQPAALVLQAYNMGTGQLKARAVVLAADGRELPGGALELSGQEGGGSGPLRISGTFQPPALEPGDYLLRVTLSGGAGKEQTSTTRFAVGPDAHVEAFMRP